MGLKIEKTNLAFKQEHCVMFNSIETTAYKRRSAWKSILNMIPFGF